MNLEELVMGLRAQIVEVQEKQEQRDNRLEGLGDCVFWLVVLNIAMSVVIMMGVFAILK